MVRFKVIKGSQLLIAIAAIVLALVVGGIVLSSLLTKDSPGVQTNSAVVEISPERTAEGKDQSSLCLDSIQRKAVSSDLSHAHARSLPAGCRGRIHRR